MAKKFRLQSNSLLARVYILNFFFLVAYQLIAGRLFVLQIKEHPQWLAKAASQQQAAAEIPPERGEIFLRGKDGSLHAAATNKHFPMLYAAPKDVERPEEVSAFVAQLTGLAADSLYRKLSKKNDPYELLAQRISGDAVEDLRVAKLKGLYVEKKLGRFYPGQMLASHAVGFVGINDAGEMRGQYGVEAAYEKTLRGKPARFSGIRDAAGKIFLRFGGRNPEPGADIVLTVDPQVQFEAERLLQGAVKKWKAKGGNVIVMEPQTGRILAMANAPAFNPNDFAKEKDFSVFLNSSVSTRYEPGSVFKAFTMAIGLETGAVTPETTYYDDGEVRVGIHVIKNAGNSAPRKNITMTRVLERSYNVGAVFVAMRAGASRMKEFLLARFRFGEKTGIDLPSELASNFNNLNPPEGRDINFATAAFGQGIAVTPLKLIQAFAAFANEGKIMQPYIVEEIRTLNGKITTREPKVAGQPIRAETARLLLPMLEAVVHGEYGSGKLARISGYRLAGKTGTGEIPYENQRGYSERVNHTFVGFGPASDPRVIILTRLEEPIGARYAEATAVPVFRELMKFILQYYEIPPDDLEEVKF